MLKCRLTHRCHWLGPFVFDPLHHTRPYRPLSRTPRPPSAARQPAKAEVSGLKMTLRDSGPERPKSARGTMSSNPVSSSAESGANLLSVNQDVEDLAFV